MKSTLRFAFATAAFFLVSALQAQVAEPETILRKVFTAVQTNDEKVFLLLHPHDQQMLELMRAMLKEEFTSGKSRRFVLSKNTNVDSLIEVQLAHVSDQASFQKRNAYELDNFKEAIKSGERQGILWKLAKLTGLTADTLKSEGNDFKKDPNGLKRVRTVFEFTVHDSAYQLPYATTFINGVWMGGEFQEVRRKKSIAEGSGNENKVMEIEAGKGTKPEKTAPPVKTTKS